MSKIEPIKKSQQEVQNGLENMYTLVLCALGVNLAAVGITQLIADNSRVWLLLIGILICLGSLFLFTYRRLQAIDKHIMMNGFIIYNKKGKDLVSVPRYTISERMWNYIHYCGDAEIRKIWNNSSIGQISTDTKNDEVIIKEREYTECDQLICELLEYCILKQLTDSVDLHYHSFSESEICVLSKNDIPEALRKNRFLKWLSEEKEKDNSVPRKVVQLVEDRTFEGKGRRVLAEAVMSDTPNMYELFELILPKKGKIEILDQKIVLEHPLFSLQVKYDYPGADAGLSPRFLQWYLGIDKESKDYVSVGFNVSIDVRFKYKSLVYSKWKRWYTWMDSFVNHMNEYLSQEAFFDSINWDTTNTVMECLERLPIVQIIEKKQE